MFLRELSSSDFLSFGAGGTWLEFRPLTVIIGPNGSGKSNLIEAIDLLRSLPKDLATFARRSGGIQDLLHNGDPQATPRFKATFSLRSHGSDLVYILKLGSVQQRLEVLDERLESSRPIAGHAKNSLYFGFENGRPMLTVGKKERRLQREDILPDQSIMAQRKDPESYPELTQLGEQLASIRIYRNWTFGRAAPARQPQQADLPSDSLLEDFSNLALVLNRLKLNVKVKDNLLKEIYRFSGRFHDLTVSVSANQVQLFLQDSDWSVPAHRLSDGTVRYLCLLSILLHPDPPPLICIEEPELGMHPDTIAHLGKLLKEASTRTQLVVTTHSDILIDALSDTPESVVVSEIRDGKTFFWRLEPDKLQEWLKEKGLGQVWLSGEIGGTRF